MIPPQAGEYFLWVCGCVVGDLDCVTSFLRGERRVVLWIVLKFFAVMAGGFNLLLGVSRGHGGEYKVLLGFDTEKRGVGLWFL